MKKIFYTLLVSLPLLAACTKDIEELTANVAALNPQNADANAGTWQPLVLAAPNEIPLAAPIAATDAAFLTQVLEIKNRQAKLTSEQRNQIAYWGAGAVFRWNEIARNLISKYNLAPYQNADGTYPFPDAANPFNYPYFPFANPPYASRAYAYLSAATYDALVAAWHYKKAYNRAAPYTLNNGVKNLLPASTLPSYPSEDAVVAGVMEELLTLFFPGEQAYIQDLVTEHRNVRMMAGMNVRSDLDAGEQLGRAVAQKFVARARGDRAGTAGGNKALWDKLEADVVASGLTPWISQESPKRPPMLPLFGKVKTWLFDSATLVTKVRPMAPPAIGSPKFQKDLEEVRNYSKNATREQIAIVHKWADGLGTSTPPGHWNAIASADFIKRQFSEVRWARNLALLNMSMADAAVACWDAKYFYFVPRPSQVDPSIKTLTGLPNFPSYTSGHSTFSSAAATVLGYIIPERKTAYEAMALEASNSRIYGAIHYRFDCEEGLMCGNIIGTYAIARGKKDGADF